MIRDWNYALELQYGQSGGRKYITEKMSIKDTQSIKSQRVRKLINSCFEEVSCFLMPKHIEKEEDSFNGSVSQLNPKFIEKMKELFSYYFDPDTLEFRTINGYPINGRDLLKYFESYIEIFNSDKLEPNDIMNVTLKATDYKIIFDLKVSSFSKNLYYINDKYCKQI